MTSPRLFTGRRLIVFLMLTTGGLAAGVTANGLATVNENLPEAFTPAQPLPGDEAEWSFLRVADGPTENALPVFRLQRLPDGYTWNSMGKPVLAEFIRTQGAQWHEANGEQVYSWSVPLTDAGAHGQTFWFERDDGFSAATEAQASNSERVDVGRSYLAASGGYIQFDCLRTTLPDSFALQESFKLERGCLFSWPFADPEGVLTESELQAKYDGIGGLALSKDQKLRAIGSSDTAYGPAVVVKAEFEAAHAQWELLLWYVESVPYPVQASVKLTDQHVVFGLSSFTRGSPEQPPVPSLAPLPPVRDAPLRPWGPDDAGVDLQMLPSEAWQVAVGDPNGGVRDFLERHPDAYMEAAKGGHEPSWPRDTWAFQLRDGDARLAVQVSREPQRIAGFIPLPDGAPPQTTVETIDTWNAGPSTPEAPSRVPDLASAAARLLAMGGGPANWFEYAWSCADWVDIGECHTVRGPVVHAEKRWHEQTRAVSLEELDITWHQETGYERLTARADGGIDAWSQSRSAHVSTLVGDSAPPVAPEPEPAASGLVWQMPSAGGLVSAGAAAGLVGLLYLLWPALKTSFLGLFSRIEDHKALEQPTRRAIYDAVEADPGVHGHALVRRLPYGKSTIDHHLRKLVASGHIVVNQTTGYTCYYPKRTDRRWTAAAPALRSEAAQNILQAAMATPGIAPAALARRVALSRATVHYHLRRLGEAGLLETQDSAKGGVVPSRLAQSFAAA